VAGGCFHLVGLFAQKGFHAVETGFVKRFEDVERCEEERAGTTGEIKDGDFLDRVPERPAMASCANWRMSRLSVMRSLMSATSPAASFR
jgi:hypothetical protein